MRLPGPVTGYTPEGGVLAQHEIEIILARQLASYLAMPVVLADPDGRLLYYNEPAESILGMRFEEVGTVSVERWVRDFLPVDEEGTPLEPDDLPIVRALKRGEPAHAEFSIRGLDGATRGIEVTSFPLIGQAGRPLGAIAVFWEVR